MAERAFAMFRSLLRGSDTEKDLADAMEAYVRRAGGKCTSFPTIVAVGERRRPAARPADGPARRRGELLLVDWGRGRVLQKRLDTCAV